MTGEVRRCFASPGCGQEAPGSGGPGLNDGRANAGILVALRTCGGGLMVQQVMDFLAGSKHAKGPMCLVANGLARAPDIGETSSVRNGA